MWRKKKEISPPGIMPTEREWNKALVERPKLMMIAAVINNGEDHQLWERFADKDEWERYLWQMIPLVTAERAPSETPL